MIIFAQVVVLPQLGLVFDMDASQLDDALPTHIEYKIRMSVDMVDTTSGTVAQEHRVTDRCVLQVLLHGTQRCRAYCILATLHCDIPCTHRALIDSTVICV